MKKKECPNCAMMVDENLDICPICSYEFAETKGQKWGVMLIAILLLFLLIMIVI